MTAAARARMDRRDRARIVARRAVCAILRPRPSVGRVSARRYCESHRHKGWTISRDLRVNQMIRIPQVRVVDEEGASWA